LSSWASDSMAGGSVPGAGRPEARIELGLAFRHQAELQRGADKEECGVRKQIQVRDARPPLVVISRSHGNDPELQAQVLVGPKRG
jgi:hypothetical protein